MLLSCLGNVAIIWIGGLLLGYKWRTRRPLLKFGNIVMAINFCLGMVYFVMNMLITNKLFHAYEN